MRMTPSTRRWALLEDWLPLLGALCEAAGGCAHDSCGCCPARLVHPALRQLVMLRPVYTFHHSA